MAGAKSIEDIFSSEVDEKEVSALVGSLVTKLAPQNPKAGSGPSQDAIVTRNHVNENSSVHAQTGPGGLTTLKQAEPGVSIHANAARQTMQVSHLGTTVTAKTGLNHDGSSKVHINDNAAQGNGQNNHGIGSTTIADIVKRESQPPAISNMMTRPPTATTVSVSQQSPAIVAQITGAGLQKPNETPISRPMSGNVMSQLRTSIGNDQQIVKVVSVPSMPSAVQNVNSTKNELGANVNSSIINSSAGTAKEQLLVRQQTLPSNDQSGAMKPRIVVQPSISTIQQATSGVATISGVPSGNMTLGNANQKVVTINVANPAIPTGGRPGQYHVVNTVPGNKAVSPHIITQTVRMPSGHHVIAPRAAHLGGQVQIRLPPGTTLPPGVVLINKGGTVQAVMGNPAAIQAHVAAGAPSSGMTYRHVQPGIVTSTAQPGRVLTSVGGSGAAIVSSPHVTTTRAGSPVVIASGTPAVMRGAAAPNATSHQTTSSAKTTGKGQGGTSSGPGAQLSSSAMDNVKKCRNFLTTLIKLASNANQPPETVQNVKMLVQNLIDAKIEPEEFTLKLQKELNSSPQPYLVPFLKRSLPLLRQTLQRGTSGSNISTLMGPLPASVAAASVGATADSKAVKPGITKITHSTAASAASSAMMDGKGSKQSQQASQKHSSSKNSKASSPGRSPSPQTKPGVSKSSKSSSQSSSKASRSSGSKSSSSKSSGGKATPSRKDKSKDTSSFSQNDDDINDVTSMAGVNLSEESARILATNEAFVGTQLRSCEDQKFLHQTPLQHRMSRICTKHGISDAAPAVLDVVSLAVQERLKQVVEKLSVISQHRLEIYRNDTRYEPMSDVRSQLKFFEQLDALERKRRDEQEREILLRAAKSRSKQEDPEQLRLKQKAKEMQQMELEQVRQQEANLTALAAIGPRKKRKLDSPTPSSSQGGASGSSSSSSSLLSTLNSPSSNTTPFLRTQFRRTKRVNMKDLLYLMEQEPVTKKSQLLYNMYLK